MTDTFKGNVERDGAEIGITLEEITNQQAKRKKFVGNAIAASLANAVNVMEYESMLEGVQYYRFKYEDDSREFLAKQFFHPEAISVDFYRDYHWRNLAPDLVRQRAVIEGTTEKIIEPEAIDDYLVKLTKAADMDVINGPFSYSAHECGFGGWIHWKTFGSHFYSYPTDPSLFSIDIYSCKPFLMDNIVEFTRNYFEPEELVWKEIGL